MIDTHERKGDLISREWLVQQVNEVGTLSLNKRNFLHLVGSAPTAANSVQIYCRDCAHRQTDEEMGKHWCRNPLGCMGCVPVRLDDYCSRGKRRTHIDG